jgi:seipin
MASKYRYDNDEEDTQRPTLMGLLKVLIPDPHCSLNDHQANLQLQSIILKPFRIVLSKPALRAYLTTALIFITALFLLAAASTAYTLFYWSYVPRIGFSRDIHLQWDDVYSIGQEHGLDRAYNHFPHGTVSLEGDLVSAQAYDVKLEIELPRTRKNREVGNFMLDVSLLGSTGLLDTLKDGLTTSQPSDSAPVLARSRRPASLHYRSLPVEMLHRITQLPWYILGVRDESETLTIDVFERTSFSRGSTSVPTALKLEVQSSKRMQIYSAKAIFHARFRGLRWLMYNHRVISAVVFVGVFWGVEMVFAGIAWAVLIAYLGPAFKTEEQRPALIKEEATSEDEERGFLSDTERTFPTLSNQQPLRFRSPEIKEEKKEEGPGDGVRLQDVPPLTNLEADDEDEDGDYFLDSGIGTSMESGSGSRPGSMRKRRGRGSFRE